jgi:hypothetical protein
MAPLTRAVLSAIFLFLSTSTAAPPKGHFSFQAGNFSTQVPIRKCFKTSTTITEGPADFKKCVKLGDTYNSVILESVDPNIANDSRCWFWTSGDCEDLTNVQFLGDASLNEGICLIVSNFDAIFYTDDCPTGSGGKL